MYAQWVPTSTGLPQEGQQIEFLMDGRETAIHGAYVQQTFQSRWSRYEIERVCNWRSIDQEIPS